MSILINMEMPKNCLECVFYRRTDPVYDYCCISSAIPKGYVPNDCPLVEVPEDIQPVKWLPVTERLPYAYKKVLTYERIRGVQVNFCDDDGEWWIGSKVTHWMPLPEPPKGAGND